VKGFSTTTAHSPPDQPSSPPTKGGLGIAATMLPVLERQLREREMCFGDCCYDDDVYVGILDHFLRGPVALDAGMVFFRIVVWLGRALDDGVEGEGGDD